MTTVRALQALRQAHRSFLSVPSPNLIQPHHAGGILSRDFWSGGCAELGAALVPRLQPCGERLFPSNRVSGLACMWFQERSYAKRALLRKGNGPYAWIKVGKDEEVPPSRPNDGSLKNRNHKKRMLQRSEFAEKQAQETIKAMRLATARRDSARVKRWKEGAERAKAWALLQASKRRDRTLASHVSAQL